MSSPEEDYNDLDNLSPNLPDSKKRRVQRACDTCRRKKIRCDGSQMPGNRCSNCIAYNFECTYVEAAKKRGPPKGYVESLENRLEKMEKLLQKVCPDADFSHELGGGRIDREAWQKGNMLASTSGHTINTTSSVHSNTTASIEDLAASDDEGIVTLRLSENFKSMLHLSEHRGHRFFGKSSGVVLIQKAIDLKKEATGSEEMDDHEFHLLRPFEEHYPWEIATKAIEPEYTFPDKDLGMQLVHLYFVHVNTVIPLLHRPSFERRIAQGVHLRNKSFAAVYLLLCAVASRFTDDPRVFLDGVESTVVERSSGWKFFGQVQMVRRTLLEPPCLEDLQTYCLAVEYLQGTSAPQASWTMVGIGIRLAQDVGAHRRKSYDGKLSVEGELWKRAFWVLVTLDRQMSSNLGRPSAIQDEDFDLDLPIECDDEYWEHSDPQQAFKQPPDKPSAIAYFNSFIKLCNILSFAHRTIYSINKSKILLGFVGQRWEQHIVAELDSSLNKWIDEVPDHLRWDPTRDPSSLFFMQSTALYAQYYVVQIFIHRPFIPSPRKPSPLSFPSLAICTNAARSCSHIMDIYRKRANRFAPFIQMQAFVAGIVLLLNIWGGKRSGVATDPMKEMADVHKCMGVLKACESRWHTSGRLWDILYELASVGDLPLPQPSPTGGTKRERDDESSSPVSRPASTPKESPRTMAGTRRVSRDVHGQPQQLRPQQPSPVQQPSPPQTLPSQSPQSYNLPVYSDDLGRLPLHGQMSLASSGATAPATMPSSVPSNTDVWFSSLAGGPHSQPPAAPVAHGFAPGDMYGLDDLFLDQITSNSFGGYAAAPPPHPGINNDDFKLDAFLAPTLAGGAHVNVQAPPPMTSMSTRNRVSDIDPDTIAMWSSAPAGFGASDWGTYLSNVSGGGSMPVGSLAPQQRPRGS